MVLEVHRVERGPDKDGGADLRPNLRAGCLNSGLGGFDLEVLMRGRGDAEPLGPQDLLLGLLSCDLWKGLI